MRSCITATLATLVLTALGLAATPENATPVPTEDNFQKWFDYIRPKKEELAYRAINWRPTLWEGVVEGHQADKPILLWAMNGHPLACT